MAWEMPALPMRNQATTMNRIGVAIMPMRSASAGFDAERLRTIAMPMIEQTRPAAASSSGSDMRAARPSSVAASGTSPPSAAAPRVAAMAIVAIIDPQYDSKMSEPMPAMSPTLSPTLSAITPGLRGSSSGMPCSSLPTRSAPTSALLV